MAALDVSPPLSSDAVPQFLQDGLPHVEPALSKAFQSARSRMSQQQMQRAEFERVKIASSRWRTFVGSIKQKSTEPSIARFSQTENFQPQDVITATERAARNYANAGRMSENPWRAMGRAIAGSHSCFKLLLEFVPDNEYTSIICAALSLVISTAAEVERIRSSILICLQSLSGGLNAIEHWSKLYEDPVRWPALWSAAEDLYVVILEASETMISWLDQSAFKHLSAAVWHIGQPGKYSKKFIQSTKELVECSVSAFRDQLNSCLHERVRQTYDLVEHSGTKLDEVLAAHKRSGEVLQSAEQRLTAETRAMGANFEATLYAGIHVMEQRWAEAQVRLGKQMESLQETVTRFQNATPVLVDVSTIVRALAVLQTESTIVPEVVFSMDSSVQRRIKARAAAVLNDDKFQGWLTGLDSRSLLVNGMQRSSPGTSAITYCVARLHEVLQQSDATTSLVYFCGEHTDWEDGLRGPVGMLRCLCTQLVTVSSVAMLELDDRAMLDSIRDLDPMVLCDLFWLLLKHIAERKKYLYVVCMVDDITELEYSKDASIFVDVVRKLIDMQQALNNAHSCVVLKLLLAAQMSSSSVDDCLAEDDILTLRSSTIRGNPNDVEDDALLNGLLPLSPGEYRY